MLGQTGLVAARVPEPFPRRPVVLTVSMNLPHSDQSLLMEMGHTGFQMHSIWGSEDQIGFNPGDGQILPKFGSVGKANRSRRPGAAAVGTD